MVQFLTSGTLFQSTHPRGVRLVAGDGDAVYGGISIHAPARGATLKGVHNEILRYHFNPRTREGCDTISIDGLGDEGEFQSTHPRGVRLLEHLSTHHLKYISIHAPARGATGRLRFIEGVCRISIHAPARGATCLPQGHIFSCCISIHAPARGATIHQSGNLWVGSISIHAPARGATCSLFASPFQHRNFNPRTREGCDG